MPEITLAQAEAKLVEWMDADTAVATGQSYTIGGRSLTRANSREIRENITFWNNQIRSLSASRRGPTLKGATPT